MYYCAKLGSSTIVQSQLSHWVSFLNILKPCAPFKCFIITSEHMEKCRMLPTYLREVHLGLGVNPGEQSFFQENKRNYQERSHLFEKRTERIEHVLSNIGTISKRAEWNGNCLNRKFKIRNVFLLSRTRSRLKTEQGGRTVLWLRTPWTELKGMTFLRLWT